MQKSAKKNQSVEKVFQIIEVMANNKGPMRLQDIAESTGYPASTVLRFLNTLQEYNYVRQDKDTNRYALSTKFCQLGMLVSSQISIRDIVHPYLLKMSDYCAESACLAIEEDMMAVYIDVVDGPDNMLKALRRIGKRAPLHSTGVGKNLLLNYTEDQLDILIKKRGLEALTPHTITTKAELIKELKKVLQQGYALDDEECEIGVRCLAASLRDYTGKVVASISISGPVSRMSKAKIQEIKDYIIGISNEVSQLLGYSKEK